MTGGAPLPGARSVGVVYAGYTASHIGKAVMWTAAEIYSLYVLVSVSGWSPGLAGAWLTAILLASAATDFGVGMHVDRRPPASGFLVAAAVMAVVSFVVGLGGMPVGVAGILVAFVVFRLAYSLYDVPHNAAFIRLSRRGRTPVTLASLRLGGSLAAAFLVSAFAAMAGGRQAGVLPGGWMLALFAVPMLLYVPGLSGLLNAAPGVDATSPGRSRKPPVKRMIFIALLGSTMSSMFYGVLPFVANALDDPAWTGGALAWVTAGKVLGIVFWRALAPRYGVLTLVATSFLVAAAGVGAAHWLLMDSAAAKFGLAVTGIGLGGVTVLSWAYLPDLAVRVGRKAEAVRHATTVAAYTALNKVGLALGGLGVAAQAGWTMPQSGADATLPALWLVAIPAVAAAAVVVTVSTPGRESRAG